MSTIMRRASPRSAINTPKRLYFYTVDYTEYELVVDAARGGEGSPSYISDLYTTRKAARAAMLAAINADIKQCNEECAGDGYTDEVPARLRDILDGVYDSDLLEMRFELQSRKVKS